MLASLGPIHFFFLLIWLDPALLPTPEEPPGELWGRGATYQPSFHQGARFFSAHLSGGTFVDLLRSQPQQGRAPTVRGSLDPLAAIGNRWWVPPQQNTKRELEQ